MLLLGSAVASPGGLTTIAVAQDGQESDYPTAVVTFSRMCLVSGVNPADRLAALEADKGWREDATVTVDIPQMGVSKTIQRNYSFNKVSSFRQWSGEIDGRKARFVLATFGEKERYPNLCALVLDGPRNAMPYSDELKSSFKAFGIGGKSVDLAHYFEFAGKVGPEKHPVRGEIFSRSLSGQHERTTHIYIAY